MSNPWLPVLLSINNGEERIRCPISDDDYIVITWHSIGPGGRGEYHAVCSTCHQETFILTGEEHVPRRLWANAETNE